MKAGASLHIYLPSEIALAARNSADFARALRRALISQSSHSAANENGCVSAAYAGAAHAATLHLGLNEVFCYVLMEFKID